MLGHGGGAATRLLMWQVLEVFLVPLVVADLPCEVRFRFVDAIVRGDILTRSVKVSAPYWQVPSYVVMVVAHPQDIPAEFKDASV